MSPYAFNTAKYKIGNSYPCGICKKRFTIMLTTTGAVLPIEWVDGKRPEGETYDPDKHTSHLLTCPGGVKRQESWAEIQKEMEKAYWEWVKQTDKLLLR